MPKTLARLTMVLTTAIALLGPVPATPEAAAAPQCTDYAKVTYRWVPVSSSGSTYCEMGYGARSRAVYILQAAMEECHGQTQLEWDGIFGPMTRDALKRVQRNVGAEPDGIYGPETYAKMSRTGGWLSTVHNGCTILT